VSCFVLEKIKEFLIKKMDVNSRFYAENTKLITIINQKSKKGKKPFSILQFLSNKLYTKSNYSYVW